MSTFKVLQFNMQFGQSWDDANPDTAPIDLDLTLAEISSHDADIILLQEVEQARAGGSQSGTPPNYARIRAALAGYDAYFSFPKADPRELPFGIGQAIFSRTPLRNTMRLDLPSPPVEFNFRGEKKTPTDRLIIGAQTTIAGHDLNVFNTHLLAFFMLESSSEDHPAQREMVIEQLRNAKGATLLGGDFNVSKHHSLINQFGQAGFQTVQETEITWRRRPYVLDHIFYSRELRPVSYLVKPTPSSDHHALVGEFEFVG
jgi:endonuclease/exonuclease/phosphatase family metal-dependent hydrolase